MNLTTYVLECLRSTFEQNPLLSMTKKQANLYVYNETRGHKIYDDFTLNSLKNMSDWAMTKLSRQKVIKPEALFNDDTKKMEHFYMLDLEHEPSVVKM